MSINSTFFAQLIVFAILVLFTMKFVWPPIAAALDERASKIAAGLAAADKAKADLTNANKRVEEELAKSKGESAVRLAEAERRAQAMIEEAKAKATEEGSKIIAAAKVEAEQQTVKARETLREQVAALAVKGAEQILRKEVNASVHADLLGRLKTELWPERQEHKYGRISHHCTSLRRSALQDLRRRSGRHVRLARRAGRDCLECPVAAVRGKSQRHLCTNI